MSDTRLPDRRTGHAVFVMPVEWQAAARAAISLADVCRHADQERHAAAVAENDREERLQEISYREELTCWPD